MDRRQFLLTGSCSSFCTSTTTSTWAGVAKPKLRGCRLALGGGNETYFWDRRKESCGDDALDKSCFAALERLTSTFGVRAGFCFYDDSEGWNAVAEPVGRFPDRPDGTVMLGIGLLKAEARRYGTLGPTDVAVQVIMAHEFGHVLQFKYGGASTRDRWQWEPHADFMAGWFLGPRERGGRATGDFKISFGLPAAVESIFEKGDSEFNDPDHHGQEEFRAAMVRAGYFDSHLDVLKAFVKGAEIAGLSIPLTELPLVRRP